MVKLGETENTVVVARARGNGSCYSIGTKFRLCKVKTFSRSADHVVPVECPAQCRPCILKFVKSIDLILGVLTTKQNKTKTNT